MNTNNNTNEKNYNLEDAENLDQYMEFVDKAAMAAMAALLSKDDKMSSYDVAQKAYKIAKQMVIARQYVINAKLMGK